MGNTREMASSASIRIGQCGGRELVGVAPGVLSPRVLVIDSYRSDWLQGTAMLHGGDLDALNSVAEMKSGYDPIQLHSATEPGRC